MPVYSWKGLDLKGEVLRGQLFARSLQDLEKHLLKKQIGLVQAQPSVWQKKISQEERLTFLTHLSSLLAAHIPVHSALTIIAATRAENSRNALKPVLTDCAALIAEGIPLSGALRMHGLADELTFAVLIIGEKTGDSGALLKSLVEHLTVLQTLKQKVRASLVGPFITLVFFCIVFFVIVIGVIPRFEVYFDSYHAPLPIMTQVVLGVSSFFRSAYALYLLLISIVGGFFILRLFNSGRLQSSKDRYMLKLPVLSSFYRSVFQAHFFTTLSMLMSSGIPLAEALCTIEETTKNLIIKQEIATMRALIESGSSLTAALQQSYFSSSEVEAYITIGESSGSLNSLLAYVARECQEKVYARLNRWVTLIQPLVILLLGGLIAILIFAIYMPLISLSSIVS